MFVCNQELIVCYIFHVLIKEVGSSSIVGLQIFAKLFSSHLRFYRAYDTTACSNFFFH